MFFLQVWDFISVDDWAPMLLLLPRKSDGGQGAALLLLLVYETEFSKVVPLLLGAFALLHMVMFIAVNVLEFVGTFREFGADLILGKPDGGPGLKTSSPRTDAKCSSCDHLAHKEYRNISADAHDSSSRVPSGYHLSGAHPTA